MDLALRNIGKRFGSRCVLEDICFDVGPATLGSEDLDPVAVPEIPSASLEDMDQGWKKHVLDQ